MKLYRGTQRKTLKGIQKTTSWTPALPVALVYAARPITGPLGYMRGAELLPTSTIHVGEMSGRTKVLDLCAYNTSAYETPSVKRTYSHCSLWDVMKKLRYGKKNGITHDEVMSALQYMHNRLVGRVPGGRFSYVYFDEYGEPTDDEEVPLSLLSPESLISWIVMEDIDMHYDDDEAMADVAGRFVVDAFMYADSFAIREAARRLGYKAIRYDDVFQGGPMAVESLLGCDIEDVEGIKTGYEIFAEDLDEEELPAHVTVRPLKPGVIKTVEKIPAAKVQAELTCAPEANPRRSNPQSALSLISRLRF